MIENNRRRNVEVRPPTVRNDKRVAIYCRVSTLSDIQEESLKAQKYGLEQVVKCNSQWTLYGVYEDQDTGRNTFRPGFHKMMLDSYENLFDIILVKSISRFSRNTVDLLETVTKLKWLGVEVRFEQENISTSDAETELIMSVHAAFAQAESEGLSEAIKWGFKSGFKSGRSKLYTRKCFGYKKNQDGELMIYEEQAIVVRQIFELYLSGYSVDMIMEELADKNINSPTGKERWSKRTIQTMLTNEKYMGNVRVGKTYTTGFPNNRQKVNRGQQDQFIMEEAHEPIIPIEVFEQVQEEMKRRSNIEVVNGEKKRKDTHYSAKDAERRHE